MELLDPVFETRPSYKGPMGPTIRICLKVLAYLSPRREGRYP